jgi:hypothetical protein
LSVWDQQGMMLRGTQDALFSQSLAVNRAHYT